jgi:hypothetical protein
MKEGREKKEVEEFIQKGCQEILNESENNNEVIMERLKKCVTK